VRALDYLAAQQWLEVKVEGVRHRFHRLRLPSDLSAVAQASHAHTLNREGRELARLHQVLELATHDGCQMARLCAHFGEVLPAPCGHCTWCLSNHSPLRLAPRPPPRSGFLAPSVSTRPMSASGMGLTPLH
jgi:ATP-dependent DNA helicase RecQ